MSALLTPIRLPLQLADDLRSIALSVATLPRLIDELQSMHRLLVAVDANLAKLGSDLEALPSQLDRANGKLDDVASDLEQMRADLGTTLPGKLNGLTEQFGSVSDDLSAMRGDMGEVLRNIEPIDDDLHSVEKATRALVPAIQELRDHIDNMRNDLSGLPFIGKS